MIPHAFIETSPRCLVGEWHGLAYDSYLRGSAGTLDLHPPLSPILGQNDRFSVIMSGLPQPKACRHDARCMNARFPNIRPFCFCTRAWPQGPNIDENLAIRGLASKIFLKP